MGARDAIAKVLANRIRVFHSSPHDIDKFDLSKIGTGQGAQSYGHGLYFAESPVVSGRGGEYWKEFYHHPRFDRTEKDAADFLSLHNFDRQKAAQQTRAQLERNMDFAKGVRSTEELASLARERAEFEKVVKLLESDKPVGPRTYEVDIKARPEEFLDWDKPLRDQPRKQELERLFQGVGAERYLPMYQHETGAQVYKGLHDRLPLPVLSEQMREVGIPGIRYLDAQSRNPQAAKSYHDALTRSRMDLAIAEQGASQWKIDSLQEQVAQAQARIAREEAAIPRTYNYVVNDPNRLEIMAKYGMAGATALPAMGALARQDEYGAQQ